VFFSWVLLARIRIITIGAMLRWYKCAGTLAMQPCGNGSCPLIFSEGGRYVYTWLRLAHFHNFRSQHSYWEPFKSLWKIAHTESFRSATPALRKQKAKPSVHRQMCIRPPSYCPNTFSISEPFIQHYFNTMAGRDWINAWFLYLTLPLIFSIESIVESCSVTYATKNQHTNAHGTFVFGYAARPKYSSVACGVAARITRTPLRDCCHVAKQS